MWPFLFLKRVLHIDSSTDNGLDLVEQAEKSRNVKLLITLVHRLFEDGNYSAALRNLERVVALNPAKASSMTVPQSILQHREYLDAASQMHSEAVNLKQHGKLTEAIGMLKSALDRTPRWAMLHSTLGYFHLLNGDFSEARRHLDTALTIDPYLPEAHNNLGMFFLHAQESPPLARSCFRRALSVCRDFPEARQNLEGLEDMVGKLSETHKCFGELGVLFWFNWKEISDSGHRFYGRHVYQQLLPHFAPQKRFDSTFDCYDFFDGDCLLQNNSFQIPFYGREEAKSIEIIRSIGAEQCYVVGVFCKRGEADLWAVNQHLHDQDSPGYIGMTTWHGSSADSFREFYHFVGQMALPFAFMITGSIFRKQSFNFLSDDELQLMGFEMGSLR